MTYRDIKATYRTLKETELGNANVYTSKQYYQNLTQMIYTYAISETTPYGYYADYMAQIKTLSYFGNTDSNTKWSLVNIYFGLIEVIKMVEKKKGSC